MTNELIQNRLDSIELSIKQERVSYSELAELQALARYIPKDNTLLLEWAGVPEA